MEGYVKRLKRIEVGVTSVLGGVFVALAALPHLVG